MSVIKLLAASTATGCFIIWLIGSLQGQETRFRFPEASQGTTGRLQMIQGLPVLTVAGKPEEIGEARGMLALKPGKRVLQYPQDLLTLHGVGFLWGLFARSGEKMVAGFPPEYRTELEALVKASNADRPSVVVGNTFFDLKKVIACSSLLVGPDRSSVDGPLLGRNLDYPSLDYIHHYSLVTVIRPAGKHAFASIGFPGLIGVLSGMNDAGLALGILEVYDAPEGEKCFDPKGIPYALCNRKILEECTTIIEAKKYLEKLPRTNIINLVMADRDGVAILEITPSRVVRRDPVKGWGVCTNHYCSRQLKPREPLNFNDSFGRYESLDLADRQYQRIGPEAIRKELNKVNLGSLTLQTMVFEPRSLKVHLSLDGIPASRFPLTTIDLKPLLKPEH